MIRENFYDAAAVSELYTGREEKRSSTDLPHLLIFGMIIILWIGIGIYAFTTGELPPEMLQYYFIIFDTASSEINKTLREIRTAWFSFTWFAVWLILLYFAALRWLTKCMIFITSFLVLSIIVTFFCFVVINGILPILFVPVTLTLLIMHGIMLYILKKVGTQVVCKTIQNACKVMIRFPSALLIVILQLILHLLVAIFTFSTIIYLFNIMINRTVITISREILYDDSLSSSSIDQSHSEIKYIPVYVYILIIIEVCISMWVSVFIVFAAQMILYGMFTTWCRTLDKKSIPSFLAVRYSGYVFRYHMGTLAFSSNIFGMIRAVFQVIWDFGNNHLSIIRERPVILFCFWIILKHCVVNSLITCTIYGNNFYHSTKDGFKILMRNPMEFAVIRMITQWMLIFGMVIIPSITVAMAAYFIYEIQIFSSYDPHIPAEAMGIIGISTMILTIIILAIFNAAIEAATFCSLETLNSDSACVEDQIRIIQSDTV